MTRPSDLMRRYIEDTAKMKQVHARECIDHWLDLQKHHPRGWPSLRIPVDQYPATSRPIAPVNLSAMGSPAAMCCS